MVNKKFTYLLGFLSLSLFVVGCVIGIVASEFKSLLWGTWAAFFVISMALIILNKEQCKILAKSRKTKRSIGSLISIFLVLCILFTINFIARKVNVSLDITKSRIHSLTAQSLSIVSSVDNNLKMNFFSRRSAWVNFRPLLQMYEESNKNINLEMFDIEKEYLLTQQKDISEQNTLEIVYKGKAYKKVVTSELDVTNLFVKVLSTRKYKIYYTIGHGELDLNDTTKAGLSFFKKQISNSQYELKAIDLIKSTKIPSDASLLLILNPKKSFIDSEISIIKTYIEKNGNTFTLLSPNFSTNNLKPFFNLYTQLGIEIHNGLVLDKLSTTVGLDPSILSINKLNAHEVTKGIKGRMVMPLNLILKAKATPSFSPVSLASSTAFPASWGELDLQSLESGKVFFNKTDFKGPLDIAYLINAKQGSAHAVFASSTWLTNQYQAQSAHFNLALNTISYILGDNALVSLNRPSLSSEPILLSNFEVSLIFYFSVLFLPFSLFGIGIYFFQKRARG